MIRTLAIALWFYILGAGCVALGWILTLKLSRDEQRTKLTSWLYDWSIKGLVFPVLLWALMNFGLSWNIQPFMPSVQAAQNSGGSWTGEWLRATAAGFFLISTYWLPVTLAWVLASLTRGLAPEPARDLQKLAINCVAGLSIPGLILWLLGGWYMLGFAVGIILVPMAAYSPSIIQRPKLPPMYARAIARIKFGKYREAEWEIIRELEKSEDDFDGWVMLAELYATRFGDLDEAERTILDLCEQPSVTPSQMSVALHKMADWHLKLGSDPVGARRSLQIIVDRVPGTHLAHMARLRLKQIPINPELWRQQQSHEPIRLPALGDTFDSDDKPEATSQERKMAAKTANALVEQLKANPDDADLREKLARTLVEGLGQAELGLEQLRLLMNMPGQPVNKRAEWLSLSAVWHMKYRQDVRTTCKLLQRVVEEFPKTVQAMAARRHLQRLGQASQAQNQH